MGDPMRYDEAFNFLFFAGPGDPKAWFSYLAPNNHVLHTLLMRLSITIAGSLPVGLRIPAFLTGVAMIPMGAWMAVKLTGRRLSGICAAALIAASSLLIEYSTNARGYSLVALLSLAMGIATIEISRDVRRWTPWIAWIVLAALGMFTIPIMLYPVGLFAMLILIQGFVGPGSSQARLLTAQRLFIALSAAAALTIALYIPVVRVSGIDAVVSNEYVTAIRFGRVLSELPKVAAQTLADWRRDTSILWDALVIVGVVTGIVGAFRRRFALLALPPIAAVFLILAALGHRVVPFPRVWLFLFPLTLVCAGCGLAELAGGVSPQRAKWAGCLALGILLTLAVVHSGISTLKRDYLISEDPHTLVNARAIARDAAELVDGQTTFVSEPIEPALSYYYLLQGSEGKLVPLISPQCRRALVIVNRHQTVEEVVAAHPVLAERFAAPRLWKKYPRATVYLVGRIPPADHQGHPQGRGESVDARGRS